MVYLLNNNIGNLVQTGYNISSKRRFGNNYDNNDKEKSTISNQNQLSQKDENNIYVNESKKSSPLLLNSIGESIGDHLSNIKYQVKSAENSIFSRDDSDQKNLKTNKNNQNDKEKKVNSIFDDIEDSSKTPNSPLITSGKKIQESKLKYLKIAEVNDSIKSSEPLNATKDEISRIFHDSPKRKIGSSFDNLVIKLNQELMKTNNLINKINGIKR